MEKITIEIGDSLKPALKWTCLYCHMPNEVLTEGLFSYQKIAVCHECFAVAEIPERLLDGNG